nr:Gfo/Idh/MocA family oxidoreductase [Corallococcus sp. AS-1-6]
MLGATGGTPHRERVDASGARRRAAGEAAGHLRQDRARASRPAQPSARIRARGLGRGGPGPPVARGAPPRIRTDEARQAGSVGERRPREGLYDYKSFDQIKGTPEVQAVYIVLPNSMHAEFTVRAAQAGKHVFCEKPMANSSAECRQMIDACKKADRKLGIAYRLQYEPHHRAVIQMACDKELGTLKPFTANNGQNQGEPNQWRHKKALAGGGALADVGIYCLSAARYFSGEEPTEVMGFSHSPPTTRASRRWRSPSPSTCASPPASRRTAPATTARTRPRICG